MTEIRISPLRIAEAEAVATLAQAIWRAHYPGIISTAQIEFMLEQRYRPVLIKQFMARGDVWLAARADEDIVGFAHAHPFQDGDWKLDKLYVQTDLQRHGIGGRLLAGVEERARQQGIERLVLRVNRENHPAIRAYLKHGFKIATLYDEDIGNGFIMNDYVMAKDLDTDLGTDLPADLEN